MAKKRNKLRESIFVTNEYFEKCGISRQVVRFSIEKEKIKPAGNLVPTQAIKTVVNDNRVKTPDSLTKSPMLYYMADADFFILSFRIENYKKYLTAVISTWEKIKEKEPFNSWSESEINELKVKLLDSDEYMNNLPAQIIELKKIIKKYFDFQTGRPKNRDDLFCNRFSREYIKGIIQRNERFLYSNKSVEAFMRQEVVNRFHGKEHLDIRRAKMIKQWFDNLEFDKIEDMLKELEKRKNAPPMEGESKDFYRLAKECYKNLKIKFGKKKWLKIKKHKKTTNENESEGG